MTDILPPAGWPNVRQLETNEFATGGANGNMNEQAKSLSARSELLKQYAALPYESKTGGYALNERVQLETGDVVRSKIPSNVNNPNENMTGWVKTSDASQIVDASGQTQQQVNNNISFFNAVSVLSPAEKADIMLANPTLDLTAKAQLAIDTATAQGKVCVFPYGTWNIKCANEAALDVQHVAGLVVPSNAKIGVMPKCTLKMISTWAWAGQLFWISEVQNVHIFGGGTILGDRATHDFTNPAVPANRVTHEWVWCVHVLSGIDIVIEDLKIRGWTADCVHVWSKNKGVNPALESKNITIKGCILDGARRNNISITDCDGFFILNNTVINAGITDANSEGTNPKSGIDLEPYRTEGWSGNERVMNGVVSGNYFKNNRAGGVLTFNCYNVAVTGNTSHGDGFNYSYGNNITISDNVFHFFNRGSNSITSVAIAGIDAPTIDWYIGFNNVVVSGNTILDFPIGIDARGVGILVENNAIKGATSRAISCLSLKTAKFSGNLIYNSVIGIGSTIAVTDVDITNNMFHNISNRAVDVRGEIKVKGNTFKHCSSELFSSGNVVFSENTIDRTGTTYAAAASVYVTDANSSLLAANNTFIAINGTAIKTALGSELKAINNNVDTLGGGVEHNSTGKCVVKGNTFTVNNASTASLNTAIYSGQNTGSIIEGNVILASQDGTKSFSTTIATYQATSSLIVNNTVTKAVNKHSSDIERGTTIVGKLYSASATYDPPSLTTVTQQSTTITLSGALVGDTVSVSFSQPLQGTRIWAEVTATNTITVYHRNDTGGTVDVASGALTVKLV